MMPNSRKQNKLAKQITKQSVIDVTANQVNVRPRRRNRRKPVYCDTEPSQKNTSAQAGTVLDKKGKFYDEYLQEDGEFNAQAKSFILKYLDPNAEHSSKLDSTQVPDGTLETSAGTQIRYLETVKFPWQEVGTTSLAESTYSFLVLQLPLLRALTIILAREHDGEFEAEQMAAFCRTFVITPPDNARYPNWEQVSNVDGMFFTILDTVPLRAVTPPSAGGVSDTVESYRFSSQGITVDFNTPDLLNQGTVVSMRYPLDMSTRAFALEGPLSSFPVFYYDTNTLRTAIPTPNVNLQASVRFFPGAIPVGNFINLADGASTPNVTVTVPFRNAANSFVASVGDELNISMLAAGTRATYLLNNFTTGTFINIAEAGVFVNDRTVSATRFYVTEPQDDAEPEMFTDIQMTVATIPPVTQSQIMQSNPKAFHALAKESGGVYVPSAIFQPFVSMTKASDYRKIGLQNSLTTESDLDQPEAGWYDTLDTNFGATVINFQSIPYACKPFIKICRGVEFVPAGQSVLTLAVFGCPAEQMEAVDICKSIAQSQPHGYPASYNGFGILFSKVMSIVELIPRALQTTRNLSHAVTQACDAVDSAQIIPRTAGLFRKMRM